MADFFKIVNNKTIFNSDGELIYFVPEKYFDIKVATIIGSTVELMGIFTYGLYNKANKLIKLDRFKLPTMFQCKPYKIEKEAKLLLNGTKTEQGYRLLYFHKGDELISHNQVPKSVDNVEKFVNLLTRANLPENIPYDELHTYILDNASMNNFNYKISPQIIGLVVSELCRNPNDLTQPFRFTDMKNMTDYKSISIIDIPKYTSPYTAITSENADKAVAAAMTTKGSTTSPLEPIMMESAELSDKNIGIITEADDH